MMFRFPRVALFLFPLALLALAVLSGCQKDSTGESKGPAAGLKQVTVEITGMT